MRLTVAVPSSGRRALLAQCLESVAAQTRAPDELLVIDNRLAGETDPLPAPAGARVLREARRGVVPARNRALAEARGEVVAFLDDDCLAPPGWLAALASCFEDPAVAAAGGPVRPLWLSPPPPAVSRSPRALSYLGLLDLGPRRRPLDPARDWLVGGNLALRRALLEPGQEFEGVFAFPGTGRCAEDTRMARALAQRHLVLYEPAAWVRHQIPAEKVRWRTLAARAFCIEAANVRLGALPEQRLSLPELLLWEGGLQTAKSMGRLLGRWLPPLAGAPDER